MSFLGYPRKNGSVGARNYIGIISTVSCANDVTLWISQHIKGSVPFLHGQGCCQTPPDIDQVTRTLISIGWNPNLAGVLVVSLGCESVIADEVVKGIAKSAKPVAKLVIQKVGGAMAAVAQGSRLAQAMVIEASRIKREEFPDSKLVLGVKCGASDTTSGLTSNPAAGAALDLLVNNGGTAIFGETTEFIGAEHILERRAATPGVADRIAKIVARMEKRATDMGVDMRGGQPTRGNIAGGLTTIEEKSLGAIVKGGTKPIQGVYEYGERANPSSKGLYIVDTPGREPEFLTALGAIGAQVIIFTTGIGAPQGFSLVPVIKITGNPNTYRELPDHIDRFIDLGDNPSAGIAQAGKALYQEVLEVASGKYTKAEVINYGKFPNIFPIGPVI
ncbi:MAG: UxaA family hydrolase [Dehalococcoidales bacterium]|nr:UxaA family hydrolase [Dehalococcoidales bacterium]